MGLTRSTRTRTGLLVLALGVTACSAPERGEDGDLDSIGQAATKPELRASSWAKLWSDLPEDRSGVAHYQACQGEPFKFTLAFRNMGSAIWRDVAGQGDEVGSDVFLTTTSGKTDTLTGKKRFSVRWDANDWVRGDRKAKECTTKRGCRRTRFIHNGMKAKAPTVPGVYTSRWRMRDYSTHWDTPTGFGPKVALRVRVEHCPAPGECACKVTCSDGAKTVIWMNGGSQVDCESGAAMYCLPYEAVTSQFVPCPPPPVGGTGGTGGNVGTGDPNEVNVEAPPDGPGFWITDSDAGSAGSSGAGGSSGEGGSTGSGASSGTGGGWGGDDPGIGIDEVPEDPEWQDDGFDGVDEEISSGVIPAEDESGCSFSAKRARTPALMLAWLGALGAVLRRRRAQKAS